MDTLIFQDVSQVISNKDPFHPWNPVFRTTGRPAKGQEDPKRDFWGINFERDIEVIFVEPLLKRLGWTAQTCIRQAVFPISGRGRSRTRIRPDYVFTKEAGRFAEASMVLEVKLNIRSISKFRVSYEQVKSYAKTLNCNTAALASTEGIWIIPYCAGNFDCLVHVDWDQLRDPMVFDEVSVLIGPGSVLQY